MLAGDMKLSNNVSFQKRADVDSREAATTPLSAGKLLYLALPSWAGAPSSAPRPAARDC